MINSILANTMLPAIHNPSDENPSQKNNFVANVIGLVNLPAELHHKIAWSLEAKDYANLRKTCTTLSENLYSFPELNNILKNKACCGEFKKKNALILNSHLVESIRKEDYLLAAIKSLRTSYVSEEETSLPVI